MRPIEVLRTLALSLVLVLGLGSIVVAGEEAGDKGETPSVEAAPDAESPEKAADASAEKPDMDVSEEEEEAEE